MKNRFNKNEKFIKAGLKKSDSQTNRDNYKVVVRKILQNNEKKAVNRGRFLKKDSSLRGLGHRLRHVGALKYYKKNLCFKVLIDI